MSLLIHRQKQFHPWQVFPVWVPCLECILKGQNESQELIGTKETVTMLKILILNKQTIQSAGKRGLSSLDWFELGIWLIERVALVLWANHRAQQSKTKATAGPFQHSAVKTDTCDTFCTRRLVKEMLIECVHRHAGFRTCMASFRCFAVLLRIRILNVQNSFFRKISYENPSYIL